LIPPLLGERSRMDVLSATRAVRLRAQAAHEARQAACLSSAAASLKPSVDPPQPEFQDRPVDSAEDTHGPIQVDGGGLQIFVVVPSRGETFPLDLRCDSTISDVKRVLAEITSVPKGCQVLALDGKVLKNEAILQAAGVRKGSTMLLWTSHPRGGRRKGSWQEEEGPPLGLPTWQGQEEVVHPPERWQYVMDVMSPSLLEERHLLEEMDRWGDSSDSLVIGGVAESDRIGSYPEKLPGSCRVDELRFFPRDSSDTFSAYGGWSDAALTDE